MSDFDRMKQFGYQVGFDLIKEGKQYLEITTDGDRHNFPHACPAAVGVAQFATDLISRMTPEIERLQKAEANGQEWLRLAREEMHQLNERIAELEQLLDAKYADIQVWMNSGSRRHHITDDQIDALFLEVTCLKIYTERGKRILGTLGIERCAECNATGVYIDPGRIDRVDCPDCHGKGWVIASETINEKRSADDE